MKNKFWAEVEGLTKSTKGPELEYRLHYKDTGEIYLCTMQDHPENTQYLIVTKSEYDRYFDYCVEDGHLKKIERDAGYHVQLKRSDQGFKTVKGHAGIILEEDYPNTEYYEYRNR